MEALLKRVPLYAALQVWGGTPSNPTRVELDRGSQNLKPAIGGFQTQGGRQAVDAHLENGSIGDLPWRAADCIL